MAKRRRTAGTPEVGRREVLRTVGAAVALAPVAPLLACSGGDGGTPAADGGPGDGGSVVDTGALADTGSRPDAGPNRWATGGTAAMRDRDSYPDPFGAAPAACALTCAMTLGPCHDATAPERADVSEGSPGLPVRLALRVVDEACSPVAGAVVDIWQTGIEGIYSGDIDPFCSGGMPVVDRLYGRGWQTTDADGRVDFDAVFPGWYRGRAIHIHFQVRLGADAYVTSQLFFEQPLIDEIFATHPDYVPFGTPDTSNAEDGIGRRGIAPYLLRHERMTDGAMQASKTIVIRSSLADALCTA